MGPAFRGWAIFLQLPQTLGPETAGRLRVLLILHLPMVVHQVGTP